MTEHILDRMARRARPAMIAGAALCLPAFLLTYGIMVKDVVATWPWWGMVIMITSHAVVALGASGMYDRQQERRSLQQSAQSDALEHR